MLALNFMQTRHKYFAYKTYPMINSASGWGSKYTVECVSCLLLDM